MLIDWRPLIKPLLAALVAVAIFAAGWTVRGWRDAKQELSNLEEVFDAQQATLTELRELTNRSAQARREQEAFHQAQRQRMLDWLFAPSVADDCRIGDAGLQLWNEANAGAAGRAAAPGATGTVSAATAGRERPRQNAGGQPRDGDGNAGRLCIAPGGAGGVGTDRE